MNAEEREKGKENIEKEEVRNVKRDEKRGK